MWIASGQWQEKSRQNEVWATEGLQCVGPNLHIHTADVYEDQDTKTASSRLNRRNVYD